MQAVEAQVSKTKARTWTPNEETREQDSDSVPAISEITRSTSEALAKAEDESCASAATLATRPRARKVVRMPSFDQAVKKGRSDHAPDSRLVGSKSFS